MRSNLKVIRLNLTLFGFLFFKEANIFSIGEEIHSLFFSAKPSHIAKVCVQVEQVRFYEVQAQFEKNSIVAPFSRH